MKRTKTLLFLSVLFIALNIFNVSFAVTLEEKTTELESGLTSEARLLMENTTGKVIYNKNGYEKRYPASTTKMLTAILTIEHCNLDETATASEFAIFSIPGGYSTANIQIGETLTIKDLLYVLMLQSANESAVILAEHVSGSQEAFADLMNQKAQEIGCKNSHFVNPNGIHNDNHYSTAYDLALIAQYCMKNEIFREIVKTTSYTLPATTAYPDETRTFINTNNLVVFDNRDRADNYYYEYATGIKKLGYTSNAKNCLVSSATKNGMEYICVILGADIMYGNSGSISARYVDTISLFNYAFDNFSFRKLNSKKSRVKTVEIENATNDTKDLNLLVTDDITVLASIDNKNSEIEPKIVLNDGLKAPISKGSKVGHIIYDVEGLQYEYDLIAGNNVKEFKPSKILLYIFIILVLLILTAFGIRFYNLKLKYLRNKYKYKNKNKSMYKKRS